jgi:hypothetical protein
VTNTLYHVILIHLSNVKVVYENVYINVNLQKRDAPNPFIFKIYSSYNIVSKLYI